MAITYTTNLSLAKPPEGHTDWADDINGNFDTLDAESIKYLLLDGESTNVTNGTFNLTTTGTIIGENFILRKAGEVDATFSHDGSYPSLDTGYGDISLGYVGDPTVFINYLGGTNVDIGKAITNEQIVTIYGDITTTGTGTFGDLIVDTTTLVVNASGYTNKVGIGLAAPTGKLHVDQSSASGAKPVLRLDQGDIDDTFIDYIGTSAADGTRSISSDTTEEGAKFGAIRCEINGVTKWIRVYDDHS